MGGHIWALSWVFFHQFGESTKFIDPSVASAVPPPPHAKEMTGGGTRFSAFPAAPKSPGEKTRYDTSLGLLTKKFIHLLSESADGVLDLNRAAEVLGVQKRRIYDITNVLEGIQLIRKKSKNNIQWMGTGIFEDTALAAKQQALRGELAELAKGERALEQLLHDCALQLRQLTDHEDNQRLAYVTYQDLRTISSFQEQTVIAVKAPPETRLEVPDFSEDNLQLHLKSTNGPIEVYLCPEEIPEDSPTKQHDVPPATTTPPPQDSSTHPSLQNNPEPPGASPQPLHGHRAPSLSPSLPLSSPGGARLPAGGGDGAAGLPPAPPAADGGPAALRPLLPGLGSLRHLLAPPGAGRLPLGAGGRRGRQRPLRGV
uniref:E2F transcription factor 2 n=1 Tax=Anas platyrhynchos platyrhynchos TaxID=8840 RepID=A0A493T7X6_ANAPP